MTLFDLSGMKRTYNMDHWYGLGYYSVNRDYMMLNTVLVRKIVFPEIFQFVMVFYAIRNDSIWFVVSIARRRACVCVCVVGISIDMV